MKRQILFWDRPARLLIPLLLLMAGLLLPQRADAVSQMGFLTGSAVVIDGSVGADWAGTTPLQSGGPYLGFLPDWDGVSLVGGHANPTLMKTVQVYARRDGSNLYLAFVVNDQTLTSSSGSLGEKIIVEIDPNHSGGAGLEHGSPHASGALNNDYRIEVTRQSPSSTSLAFFDSTTDPMNTACGRWDWNQVQPTPPTLLFAVGNAANQYTVEVQVPLSLIGTPTSDIGIAFAVVNDLNHAVAGAADATGLAFPGTLPLTNASNVISDPSSPTGCGDWLTPGLWGTGYFVAVAPDVTIARTPVWWSSVDIQAFECDTPGYHYYGTTPCKLKLQATLHNTGTTAQKRNILFMWADHGASPSVWRFIDIQEGVSVPPAGTSVFSALWNGVPPNLANHPCVRVYILPPGFRADFTKAQIIAIGNPAQLSTMETKYGVPSTSDQVAQKNLSDFSTAGVCPNVACRVTMRLSPDRVAETGAAEGRGAIDRRGRRSSAPLQLVRLRGRPQLRAVRAGRGVLLGPRDLEVYARRRVMVQVRAFGSSRVRSRRRPSYNFIEDLGGVQQMFDVEFLRPGRAIPIQLKVTNPGREDRTINLAVDTRVPRGVGGVIVRLETELNAFKAGETRVVRGVLVVSRRPVGSRPEGRTSPVLARGGARTGAGETRP